MSLTHGSSDVYIIQLGEQLSLFYNPFFSKMFFSLHFSEFQIPDSPNAYSYELDQQCYKLRQMWCQTSEKHFVLP